MVGILEFIFISIYLMVAALFDIKTREVPDILSYSFIALGFANGVVNSITQWSFLPILVSAIGFASMLLLSLLLFYTGQWGGGDSKLLMGIGTWLGLWFVGFPIIGTFLINAILLGGIYGLAWSIYLIASHFRQFLKEFIKLESKYKVRRLVTTGFVALAMVLSFVFLRGAINKLVGLMLCLLMLITLHLWFVVKAVEKVCFFKWIAPKKLTEGDWVVRPIRKGKKIIVKPSDFGVTKEQIAKMVELQNAGQLDRVLVKEGIPFVPPLFLAALVTWIFQNWFLNLI